MLMEDAPELGWIYVDVYTGNGWNAHQLGEKINDYGIMIATEMNGPLEQHVPWTHWVEILHIQTREMQVK